MLKSGKRWWGMAGNQSGFSMIEVIIAIVVLPFVISGVSTAFNSIRQSYTLARQYNEIYTVLSACPELDRALEFSSLTNTTNCYPNNSFAAENGQTATISYSPSLTVTDTSSLTTGDPLKTIPDSKVVSISVGFPAPNTSRPALQLRMLITRNGIGQQ
jgi:prepilin-type N-terminal cleavage/methylation domain-containing protein